MQIKAVGRRKRLSCHTRSPCFERLKYAMVRQVGAISCVAVLLLGGCDTKPAAEINADAPVAADDAGSQFSNLGAITGCDASIPTGFKPDANTTVTLVKSFKSGDVLTLTDPAAASPAPPASGGGRGGRVAGPPPVATNDVCVVKLLVGPGHPGPADAPSTSAGIGIEIWLPAAANWNQRVHMLGGGGCSREGSNVVSLTVLGGTRGSTVGQSPAGIATLEGAVSAMTDTGHTTNDCSFGMNPDGSLNTVGWMDFSRRSLYEMVTKTKALAAAYYGSVPEYTYFDGFSTGGRQAQTFAQVYPAEVDGILGGAPAMNGNHMSIAGIYPSVVYQRELDGVALTDGQRALLGEAATNACDVVGGVHLGYIPDPSTCTYDPMKDPAVLCAANGGTNETADCVAPLQAEIQNKIWYGITQDGSAPSPETDNGWSVEPHGVQLWYGLSRGTNSWLARGAPFGVMADHLAIVMGDPSLATPSFVNATGNGENGWKNLSYADLAEAISRGVQQEAQLGYLETNNPDLSALENAGTKFIHYHGLADTLIPPQGSIHYYNRAAEHMGGFAALQDYYRFYLVPSMGHGLSNGATNREANPPLPTHAQLYKALTDWVEKGIVPGRIDITTQPTPESPAVKSRPLCPYPHMAAYKSGDPNLAASYVCP